MNKKLKPKISICIPLYNRKKYIKEAVESAINQTFKDIEVIVLDDGSTDGSREYLEELNLPIKLYHQENAGHAKALNKLIELANGEYITFLDSDDVFFPDTVERLYNTLINYGKEAISYGAYYRTDEKGKIIGKCKRKLVTGKITNALFQDNIVHCVGTLMPINIFEKVGYYPTNFRTGKDLHFNLRASLKYDYVHLDEPVFLRRRHDDNMSTFSYIIAKVEKEMLEDFYYNWGGKDVIDEKIAKKRFAKENYRVGKAAVMEKRDDAGSFFKKAFVIYHRIKYLFHWILRK